MESMKFFPGQRVRCLDTFAGQFTAGKDYTVRSNPDGCGNVGIKEDDSGRLTNGWSARKFEAVFFPRQRVRCLSDCPGSFTKGKHYTVLRVDIDYGGGRFLSILEDDIGRGNGWNARYFWPVEGSTINTGAKYDEGKLLFSCLTRGLAGPLRELVKVLTYGAQKYSRNSWQGLENAQQRYEDALDRHLSSWREGEALDPESGLHHLAHAGVNVLFLLWFQLKGEKK